MPRDAAIALGTNLGDRLENLTSALRLVDANEFCEVVAVSHAYETVPWGISDQPPFANAVAIVRTTLRADDMLGMCQEIEQEMGRDTRGPRNGPRVIDLDILLFEDEEWDTLGLKVPHPRMAERDFAIVPLLEIRPDSHYPDGTRVTRDDVTVGRVSALLGMVPGYEQLTPPREESPAEGADDEGLPPMIRPLPGEEWVSVFEYADDPTFYGMANSALKGHSPLGAGVPHIDASFVQVVLDQEGIPHAWDPFPPDKTTDPYGFKRRYRLKVPASLRPRAERVIQDAQQAPIDWSDADFGDDGSEPGHGDSD
jgi:2-amino-4-hydroxy-6-hydroxymethyldihydropteridine diphosphokinase